MEPIIIITIISILEAIGLVALGCAWVERGGWIRIYKERIDMDAKKDQKNRLKMENLEEELVEKEKEILALRIEVDASIEQLSKDKQTLTLKEDQIERIREIIQGDTVGTEDSESE